jgi:hypothetical protein
MAQYQILYWHDIPTQVRAREGRERVSQPLPDRFMEAVDQAAMVLRSTSADDYMAAFHWSEPVERPGSAQEVAAAVAAELDAQYPVIDWRRTVDRVKAQQQAASSK